MENQFLWQEQLKKFEQVYLANGINEQFGEFLQQHLQHKHVNHFSPREAKKLYTSTNNIQYHLNGRSILGIKRTWIYEGEDQPKIKHGCSINTGLIQSDHSAFMTRGNMKDTFVEAKNREELLDIVKRLLTLSNEEMAREFNITSSSRDIATLFNAIVLDPIIDYEIQRNNFEGYSYCWNDENHISISTKDKSTYTIELINSSLEDEDCRPMTITLPNGESISFRQKFNTEKEKYEHTIDDISTEIIEVKGNSELLQKVVAQIERFSERELEQEDNSKNAEYSELDDKPNSQIPYGLNMEEDSESLESYIDESEEGSRTESPEEVLEKQIIVKKLQSVLEASKDNTEKMQTINIEEFELLVNEMLYGIGRIK